MLTECMSSQPASLYCSASIAVEQGLGRRSDLIRFRSTFGVNGKDGSRRALNWLHCSVGGVTGKVAAITSTTSATKWSKPDALLCPRLGPPLSPDCLPWYQSQFVPFQLSGENLINIQQLPLIQLSVREGICEMWRWVGEEECYPAILVMIFRPLLPQLSATWRTLWSLAVGTFGHWHCGTANITVCPNPSQSYLYSLLSVSVSASASCLCLLDWIFRVIKIFLLINILLSHFSPDIWVRWKSLNIKITSSVSGQTERDLWHSGRCSGQGGDITDSQAQPSCSQQSAGRGEESFTNICCLPEQPDED